MNLLPFLNIISINQTRKVFCMKKSVCTGVALLLLFAGAAFAEDITIVSRKLEDKDFSRIYTVTLDRKSVKAKDNYYTAAVTTIVEQKETFKPGETRNEKRTSKYLYAFRKNERKYKVLSETESVSYSGNSKSQREQSASHSAMSISESGFSDWTSLPKDADDTLNKIYDKTLEIGKK